MGANGPREDGGRRMNRLNNLRAFAQGLPDNFASSPYPREPLQQPQDFLSWPWVKKKKLLTEYLQFNRDTHDVKVHKVDYSPLLWSQQARIEALNFFCEANRLIRVRVYSGKGQGIKKNTILEPLEQLRIPLELFDDEMTSILENGVTLDIQVGEGCGNEKPTSSTNCVYDRIFGFNKFTWAEYCQSLASNTVPNYTGMSINLNERYRANFKELIPDFLIHLSYFRGAGGVYFTGSMSESFFVTLATCMAAVPIFDPSEWHDLMLGLLEEAAYKATTETFDAGLVLLSRAYTVSQLATDHLDHLSELTIPDLDRKMCNGTHALCTKVSIVYAWATHLWLESRIQNGHYTFEMLTVIIRMSKAVRSARIWPGMTSRQLAGFHFVAGLFYEHVAAFMATGDNAQRARAQYPNEAEFMKTPDQFRLAAAHHQYAASKINPAKFGDRATERWNSLYARFSAGRKREEFEVRIETLFTATGGEWYGWRGMWGHWDPNGLLCLEAIREKETRTLSKSQVKKLRERLGLGCLRKDPAGFLRCLAI